MFSRAAVAAALVTIVGMASADIPASERQQQLKHLLKHDCGACHGMHLTGGLGSALTRDALRDKPDAALRHTILHGRRGTPMPPFKNLLSADDVEWLIYIIRNGLIDD